jgi:hypothetical protein
MLLLVLLGQAELRRQEVEAADTKIYAEYCDRLKVATPQAHAVLRPLTMRVLCMSAGQVHAIAVVFHGQPGTFTAMFRMQAIFLFKLNVSLFSGTL